MARLDEVELVVALGFCIGVTTGLEDEEVRGTTGVKEDASVGDGEEDEDDSSTNSITAGMMTDE